MNFDEDHAIKYGVDEAIMINNFRYWIRHNKANGKHFHDGRYWTYNSVEAFKRLFLFWTPKQLRRIIESLVDKKVIMRGNYNKLNMDRTGWYAFINEDAFLGICDLPNQENAIPEKGTPIPDIKLTDIPKDSIKDETSSSEIFSEEQLKAITKQPKQTKPKKQKEARESSEVFKSCKTHWLEVVHPKWAFTSATGENLYGFISKLKKRLTDERSNTTDTDISDLFKVVCGALPEWYKTKDIPILNSKFNELLEEIKNEVNGTIKKNTNGRDIGQQYRTVRRQGN